MTEKKVMPKLEESAMMLFNGDKLNNIISFTDFLKENKLSTANSRIKYKGSRICYCGIYNDFWIVSFFYQFKSIKWFEKCEKCATNETKEYILANINTEPYCRNSISGINGKCNGHENVLIFGKMFDRVCHCHPLLFINPDGKTLEYAKELVILSKNIITDITKK